MPLETLDSKRVPEGTGGTFQQLWVGLRLLISRCKQNCRIKAEFPSSCGWDCD